MENGSMRKKLLVSILPILCVGFLRLCAGAQGDTASVSVSGAVKNPLTLTEHELSALPRAEATLNEHGKSVHYEGVLVSDVLKKAGAPAGGELRGKALATYVIARGRDGYEVVYSIAELDPGLTEAKVLLANRTDGKPLGEATRPFRLVAPGDKKMARSVRMLEKLEVVRLQP
jgi:DMSO/TMAO reductase YedYZ molybdopterin-dependent catalytic subunit